jgi:hypothetical protein
MAGKAAKVSRLAVQNGSARDTQTNIHKLSAFVQWKKRYYTLVGGCVIVSFHLWFPVQNFATSMFRHYFLSPAAKQHIPSNFVECKLI